MTSKLWVFRDIDPGRRAVLARALSISPTTASLLLARGVTTPDEATAWMTPLRAHDPFLIPDIEAAIADDPDWSEFKDIDWSDAVLVMPARKKAISIRVDEDVLTAEDADQIQAAGDA